MYLLKWITIQGVYLPMQKVLYFNNLFYINDLYMYMCLSRDKLGTKIGVKKGQTGDKNWGKKCKKEQV